MIKTSIELIDIHVQKVELPMGVRAFTLPDNNGGYYVFINDRLSADAADKAYHHELDHIGNEDFIKSIPGHILN